jgi:hypothetical protein
MDTSSEFPSFDVLLPDLNQFILGLVEGYGAGKINSWEDLEEMVNAFFTPERMDQTALVVPHWRKMASYADGLTLVHVMCVFMGLYMLPEFLAMSEEQQGLMKWAILFHDVEKEPRPGKRDYPHAFRSAAGAALALPKLGFPTASEYDRLIYEWNEFTRSAITVLENSSDPVQDNRKLPHILDGIRRMFGQRTPAALILQTILFHLAVDMDFWPPPAPISDDEMKKYFDRELIPLLRVMHLADGEGWQLFDPGFRERGRIDTLSVFERIERLISTSF